jgi:hypothetical protein
MFIDGYRCWISLGKNVASKYISRALLLTVGSELTPAVWASLETQTAATGEIHKNH